MSLFKSLQEKIAHIKRPRDMSLNHWRYRLLHFTFCQGDVKRPSDSSLPNFLYTHYCPLFHLTNLLALAFPIYAPVRLLIFLITKICIALSPVFLLIGSVGGMFFMALNTLIVAIVEKLGSKRKAETVERQLTTEELRHKDLVYLSEHLQDEFMFQEDLSKFDFERYWALNKSMYKYIDKEEAERSCEILISRVIWAREAQKRKKERILWWIDFSRNLFKCGLETVKYVGSFAIVVGLILSTYMFGFAVLQGIANFFTMIFDNGWIIAQFAGIISGVASFLFFVYLAWNAGKFNFIAEWFENYETPSWLKKFGSYLAMPFLGIYLAFAFCFIGIYTFCSTFYEDNCPVITIKEFQAE